MIVFKNVDGVTIRDELPFFERDGIIFNDTNIASIIPTLIYMLCSVGTDIMCGTLTNIDSVMVLNVLFNMAKDSYMDAKLACKGVLRNIIIELTHNLKQTKVPLWSKFGTVKDQITKNTFENLYVRQQILESKKERKEKLDGWVYEFIEDYNRSCSNMHDVIKVIAILHSMSNDRTYYKTLVELSLDDAVKTKIQSRLVTAPNPVIFDAETRQVYEYEYNTDQTYEYWTYKYLMQFADLLAGKAKNRKMDDLWLDFLTTSSAGQKLTPEQLLMLPELARKYHNKRLIRQAITAKDFRDSKKLMDGLIEQTNLVVRQQEDRRQRAIAGLNMEKLMLSFPSYIIGKSLYGVLDAAAQGKQTGNVNDRIIVVLYYTKRYFMLFS